MTSTTFNNFLTGYFTSAFAFDVVLFLFGPTVFKFVDEIFDEMLGVVGKINIYGYAVLFFGVVSIFPNAVILNVVLENYNYSEHTYLYIIAGFVLNIRNIIYTYYSEKEFVKSFNFSTLVYWVIVGHGIYLIWN